MRDCNECRFAYFQDYGYSNYTVEGTEFYCLKNAHPESDGFDRWYGKDERLKVDCVTFEKGSPVEIDCDWDSGEIRDYADEEQAELYIKRFGGEA